MLPAATSPAAISAGLRRFRHFLIDLDGVTIRTPHLLPGALEFLSWLRQQQLGYLFLSNNSTETPQHVVQRLQSYGLPVKESEVLTAATATAAYVAKECPGGKVYVLGTPALAQQIEEAGCQLEVDQPDVVVVGLDFDLTYDRLKKALHGVLGGARFVAVNRDPVIPVADGVDPGCGSIVAAVATGARRDPVVIGKPEPGGVYTALERLGAQPETTAIIGDGLDLDILAGQRSGIGTILLMTGVTSPETLAASPITPDYVFDDLSALLAALRG